MTLLEKYTGHKNYIGNELKKLKLLEDAENTAELGFDSSDSSNFYKDDLLNENLRLAREDIYQEYQTKKKNILLAYLLLFFTFTVIPNLYVGRRRWAFAQLVGLISIIIFLLIFTIIDFPREIYPFLDSSLLFLILGVWVFDFFTLWFAVVQYNSKLQDLLFNRLSQKFAALNSSIVPGGKSATVPSTIHKDTRQIQTFTKTSDTP